MWIFDRNNNKHDFFVSFARRRGPTAVNLFYCIVAGGGGDGRLVVTQEKRLLIQLHSHILHV